MTDVSVTSEVDVRVLARVVVAWCRRSSRVSSALQSRRRRVPRERWRHRASASGAFVVERVAGPHGRVVVTMAARGAGGRGGVGRRGAGGGGGRERRHGERDRTDAARIDDRRRRRSGGGGGSSRGCRGAPQTRCRRTRVGADRRGEQLMAVIVSRRRRPADGQCPAAAAVGCSRRSATGRCDRIVEQSLQQAVHHCPAWLVIVKSTNSNRATCRQNFVLVYRRSIHARRCSVANRDGVILTDWRVVRLTVTTDYSSFSSSSSSHTIEPRRRLLTVATVGRVASSGAWERGELSSWKGCRTARQYSTHRPTWLRCAYCVHCWNCCAATCCCRCQREDGNSSEAANSRSIASLHRSSVITLLYDYCASNDFPTVLQSQLPATELFQADCRAIAWRSVLPLRSCFSIVG